MTIQAIEVPVLFGNRRQYEPPFESSDVTGDESLMYQQMLAGQRRARAVAGLSAAGIPTNFFDKLKNVAQAVTSGGFGTGTLNHGLVPFRSMPVFLRQVDTMAEVLDYAAGGFHVAVARGLAGGAADSSVSFGKALLGGRAAISPQKPLNRADLVPLWTAAAVAYRTVFDEANAGPGFFVPLVDKLREANSLADRAYAAEGIAPPRDPGPGSTEVPAEPKKEAASGSRTGLYVAGLAVAGIVGFMAFRPSAKKVRVNTMGLSGTRRRRRRR